MDIRIIISLGVIAYAIIVSAFVWYIFKNKEYLPGAALLVAVFGKPRCPKCGVLIEPRVRYCHNCYTMLRWD